MEINHWIVLGCAVLSMVVGGLWYGPLFGKQWMALMGGTDNCVGGNGAMWKKMMPLYLIQFVLTLFQLYVLVYMVTAAEYAFTTSSVATALWLWAAFIMPTVAGATMWTGDTTSAKWSKFLIQAGYQFVIAALFGIIFGMYYPVIS
ncbi:MAG: DUF1761 domain-containing protein [Patescibacteria group bacterium]